VSVQTATGRWQREEVDLDGEPTWGVFDGEQHDEFKDQYILLGVDEDQASLATVLLDYQVVGDPDTRDRYNLREDLAYQVERVPCRLCHTPHSRAGMKADESGFVCRECQT
jgi:hypothetical protein